MHFKKSKRMRSRTFLLLAANILEIAGSGALSAQTALDLKTQSRNVDFSQAVSTKVFRTGTALPATCTVGESYLDTSNPAQGTLHLCAAPNLWSGLNQASSPTPGLGILVLGSQISVEDAVIPLYFTGIGVPSFPCTTGRDRFVDTVTGKIYLCTAGQQWSELARIDAANQWGAGRKQSFQPAASAAGINIGSLQGSPSQLEDGDLWYDPQAGKFRCRENGATVDCISPVPGAAPNPADTSTANWNEEFSGGSLSAAASGIGELNWSALSIQGSCPDLTRPTPVNRPGVLRLTTAATGDTGCVLALGGTSAVLPSLATIGDWEFRWVWRAADTASLEYKVGLFDPSGGAVRTPADGIWIRFHPAEDATHLSVEVRSAGVSASGAFSSVANPGDSWYSMRLRSAAPGQWLVSVSADGTNLGPELSICQNGCSIATALPASSMSPFFEVFSLAAGTGKSIDVDAWKGVLRVVGR